MSDGYQLEAHLFVCTNIKDKGESCGRKGAAELRDSLKRVCQEEDRDWHGRVRVNASGCLGRCKEGIAAVLYPQNQWTVNLKSTDSAILIDQLKKVLD